MSDIVINNNVISLSSIKAQPPIVSQHRHSGIIEESLCGGWECSGDDEHEEDHQNNAYN